MADVNYEMKLGETLFTLVTVGRGTVGSIPLHSHSGGSFELHYIVQGSGRIRIGNPEQIREMSVYPGMFFLTGPGVEHEQVSSRSDPMEEIGIYYTAPIDMVKSAADVLDGKKEKKPGMENWMLSLLGRRFWAGEIPSEVSELLIRLWREVNEKKSGFQTMIPFLAGELLITLGRMYETTSGDSHHVYIPQSQELKYLLLERAFLEDPVHLTIRRLSEILGLSVRQVQRMMKQHYGVTFREMQQQYRVELGRELLKKREDSIEKISETAGFSSIESFRTAFCKRYQMTPSQYRKKDSSI
ncbi:MAG: helix-turn-helix domain-containing protein [Fusicatenibacter sp.]|nr:helix-turn-helix domain-containing protein [Fusicatenibacter sp.]